MSTDLNILNQLTLIIATVNFGIARLLSFWISMSMLIVWPGV